MDFSSPRIWAFISSLASHQITYYDTPPAKEAYVVDVEHMAKIIICIWVSESMVLLFVSLDGGVTVT